VSEALADPPRLPPRWELVHEYIRACGLTDQRHIQAWKTTWVRLRNAKTHSHPNDFAGGSFRALEPEPVTPDLEVASDHDLLTWHVQGHPEAFTELVQRHQNMMLAVAVRRLGSDDEAADALQDALLAAYRLLTGSAVMQP
jgi:hypothetical protein